MKWSDNSTLLQEECEHLQRQIRALERRKALADASRAALLDTRNTLIGRVIAARPPHDQPAASPATVQATALDAAPAAGGPAATALTPTSPTLAHAPPIRITPRPAAAFQIGHSHVDTCPPSRRCAATPQPPPSAAHPHTSLAPPGRPRHTSSTIYTPLDPLPPAVSSFRRCAGIAYTDLIEASGSFSRLIDFSDTGFLDVVHTAQATAAKRLGCSQEEVCWFVQSHYEVVPGVPLSFSTSISTPECAVSAVLHALLGQLESAILGLEIPSGCSEASDDLPRAVGAGTGGGAEGGESAVCAAAAGPSTTRFAISECADAYATHAGAEAASKRSRRNGRVCRASASLEEAGQVPDTHVAHARVDSITRATAGLHVEGDLAIDTRDADEAGDAFFDWLDSIHGDSCALNDVEVLPESRDDICDAFAGDEDEPRGGAEIDSASNPMAGLLSGGRVAQTGVHEDVLEGMRCGVNEVVDVHVAVKAAVQHLVQTLSRCGVAGSPAATALVQACGDQATWPLALPQADGDGGGGSSTSGEGFHPGGGGANTCVGVRGHEDCGGAQGLGGLGRVDSGVDGALEPGCADMRWDSAAGVDAAVTRDTAGLTDAQAHACAQAMGNCSDSSRRQKDSGVGGGGSCLRFRETDVPDFARAGRLAIEGDREGGEGGVGDAAGGDEARVTAYHTELTRKMCAMMAALQEACYEVCARWRSEARPPSGFL